MSKDVLLGFKSKSGFSSLFFIFNMIEVPPGSVKGKK